ncbi:MAG: divergent PAP2 family protein [Dehalococcoidia bacterium]
MFIQAAASLNAFKAIWVPLVAWFFAQLFKVIILLVNEKRLDLSLMYSPGGMPSAHAALMTALATTMGLIYGFDSPFFAISLAVAFIVMYDAAGVRRTVGYQSTMLNKMLDELFKGNKEFSQRLSEIIGHSKWEVFVGAVLGIAMAMLFTWPW